MATTTPHIDQFFIQVHGDYLPREVMDNLDDAVVEEDLAQPAMFVLRFNDPQLTLLDGELLRLGSEVKLAASNPQGKNRLIMVGEITALEPVLEQHNTVLVVRGYDRSHRLCRGSRTRTFLKQSDDDIVRQIAREASLKADIEPVGVQHAYVMQDNQTDMAFLRSRAARIGYHVVVEDWTLRYRPLEKDPPAAPAQDWGTTLLSFRARLSAIAQPGEVEVRGWDPQTKQAIVGKASRPTSHPAVSGGQGAGGGERQSAGQVAERAFGAPARMIVTTRPVADQSAADRLAQAALDDIDADYFTAEGVCRGEPAIKAGTTVELRRVGKRLAGAYFVTATRHEYTAQRGYLTTFYVTGRRPNGLLAALGASRPHPASRGVAVGVVTNIDDPEHQGRVRVAFPWLDDGHESDWARLALAGAGDKRAMLASLAVNDEVLVAFEHDDINRPYVIGSLWNGKDHPPQEAVRDGRALVLLKTAGEHMIVLDDVEKKLRITSGQQSITLDPQGRKVSLESGGEVEIKGAGGQLRIGAQGVELSSSAIVSIQGSLVKINS
ncbi:MAG: VgrG-related protein [Chloroflexales bacterium]|nr:VgrG-related protein [Chloroflexales bacterium]